MTETKSERLTIRITKLEDDILKMISNGNSKSLDNRTNNAYTLFKYGLVFFINLNNIKSVEDFKKWMETIKKSEFTFNFELEKFYNRNKKGGAT